MCEPPDFRSDGRQTKMGGMELKKKTKRVRKRNIKRERGPWEIGENESGLVWERGVVFSVSLCTHTHAHTHTRTQTHNLIPLLDYLIIHIKIKYI